MPRKKTKEPVDTPEQEVTNPVANEFTFVVGGNTKNVIIKKTTKEGKTFVYEVGKYMNLSSGDTITLKTE